MKSILATMTIVLGLLSVAVPAMAGPNDTDNATQSRKVFDRLGSSTGG